jgi:hypothetical protein
MKKICVILIGFLLISCSGKNRNLEKNLEELDKIHGTCDNPHRNLTKSEYKVCKDKERVSKGDELDAKSIADLILGQRGGNVAQIGVSPINIHLWNGAMETVKDFPLKNVDSVGGYLETEWIYDDENNQRCAIKIKILSQQLISTAVQTNMICQDLNNDVWLNSKESLDNESKQITLTVLDKARKSKIENSL